MSAVYVLPPDEQARQKMLLDMQNRQRHENADKVAKADASAEATQTKVGEE